MNAATIGLGAGLLLVAAAPIHGLASFDECEEQLDVGPYTEEAANCYQEVALNQGEYEAAAHRLRGRIDGGLHAPWLYFSLGNVLMFEQQCPAGSIEAYEKAVSLFIEQSDKKGKVFAQTSLAWLLGRCRRLQEAYETLQAAEEDADDSLALWRINLVRLRIQMHSGGDLEVIRDLLKELWHEIRQPTVDHQPRIWPLRRECLRALEWMARILGKTGEARNWIEERLNRARRVGNLRDRVGDAYALATLDLTRTLPSDRNREKILGELHEALSLTERVRLSQVEAQIRLEIARMEGGAEAESHLERCRLLAEERGDEALRRACMLALVGHRLDSDPAAASRLLAEVSAKGPFTSEDSLMQIDGWQDHLRVLLHTQSRDEALAGAERVIATVEALRSKQTGRARLELLDVWADPYYWLSGRLLADAADGHDPSRAFTVMERLRAQELREILLLSEDSELHLPPPSPDLLDEVVMTLGEDEAMLSFQLGLWQDFYGHFAGGAWVLASTREGTRVHQLEVDRVQVEPAVVTLLAQKDGRWPEERLVSFHESLLRPVLEALPPGIKRLVLIPDGILHLLPFAALRSASDARALGEEYEISIEPSAALWLSWKKDRPAGGGPVALVLADPEPPAATGVKNGPRVSVRGEMVPLPHARREGKTVLRHLGGAGLLLRGAEASEQFLKKTDLRPYGLLHFATHAVAEDESPWASHVLLASSDDTEDGRLHPHEIAELELDGKVIVLSACNSAAGGWHRGEGVMSLARAFFKAGAHAVVGTLRPLPDDQGALFFDDFYGSMSEGDSLRRALAVTQRRWAVEERPASTWASVVAMGNGDLVLAPGGVEKSPWVLGALSGCLLAAVLLGLRDRRGRRDRKELVQR